MCYFNGYCNGLCGVRLRYDGFYGIGMLFGVWVVWVECEVY